MSDSTLMRSHLVSLSSDGRFVAIAHPGGLRVVDAVQRELLHEIESDRLQGFAMVQQQLWIALDERIDCYALPSLEPRSIALTSDAPGLFTASPAGRAVVFSTATASLMIEDDGARLLDRPLVLPPGATVAAVADAGHVWVSAGNELLLLDGAGVTTATVRFAATERLLGAAVLSGRPALAVLLRQEDHDVLLTLDSSGERLARASFAPVQLLRIAEKRMLAVLATGPRSVSAVDLRYCRSVAATETASDVADIACSADAASFVVAGTMTAPGEFQVRQLSYKDMFQPAWPGQDELLRVERPRPTPPAPVAAPTPSPPPPPPQPTTTAPPKKRASPKLESVPIHSATPTARTDEAAPASESDLQRLLAYVRRLLAGEKQRRLSHPGLDNLIERYALSEIDAAMLILSAAPHLDPALRDDIARLRGDGEHVDGALALKLCAGGEAEVPERMGRLDESAPLLKNGLVRLLSTPLAHAPSLAEHELFPTARALAALRGSDEMDPLLASLATLVDCKRDDAVGIVSAGELDRLAQLAGAALTSGSHALFVAPADAGLRRLLRGVAASLGYSRLLATDVALLPTDALSLGETMSELCHEAAHRELPLLIENLHAWRDEEMLLDRLRAVLQRAALPVWTTSDRELRTLWPVLPLRVTILAPDEETRAEAWQLETTRHKITLKQPELDELGRLPLGRVQIADAVALAAALAANNGQPPGIAPLRRAVDALFGSAPADDPAGAPPA